MDKTASHVGQSPENQRAEYDTVFGKPDDTPEQQHDHDVEDEL